MSVFPVPTAVGLAASESWRGCFSLVNELVCAEQLATASFRVFGICVSPRDKVNCYQTTGCRREATFAQICLNSPQYDAKQTNEREKQLTHRSCSSSHIFKITIARRRKMQRATNCTYWILNTSSVGGRKIRPVSQPQKEDISSKSFIYFLFFFFFLLLALSSATSVLMSHSPPRRTGGTLSTMCDNSQLKVQRFCAAFINIGSFFLRFNEVLLTNNRDEVLDCVFRKFRQAKKTKKKKQQERQHGRRRSRKSEAL